MKTETLTQSDLEQFTGDLERYRTFNPGVIYTPGVKYLAERAGAYWLIDAIASYLTDRVTKQFMDERLETLQFWHLDVRPDSSATLSARADSDVPPFITQEIEYTDFPLEAVDIWAGFDGHRWTLYLPSEH